MQRDHRTGLWGWWLTRRNGQHYYDRLRKRAIDVLREMPALREEGWTFEPEQFGPFEMLFHQTGRGIAIAIDGGAWRNWKQHEHESAMSAYAGRSGFHLLVLQAQDVLADPAGAVADAMKQLGIAAGS